MQNGNYMVVIEWESGIEKIYEYVISNCYDFFKVNNASYLSFKIIPFDEAHQLYIALYNDDILMYYSNLFDELDYSKLSNTGLNYVSINLKNTDEPCEEIIRYKGNPVLKENEIRYLNLNLLNILEILSKILTELVSNLLKEEDFFSKIFFDANMKLFKFFISDNYDDINNSIAVKKFKDISSLVEKNFL